MGHHWKPYIFSGFDPEIGSGVGIDRGIYPQARTHSIGINISFI